MASELYRVVLHFRSNFSGKTDIAYVEEYVCNWIRSMQGIGNVTDVEVTHIAEVLELVDVVSERTTIPAPPSVQPESVPVIIEEPDTGKKTRLPGTGDQ